MPFEIDKVAQETKPFKVEDFAEEVKPFKIEDFAQPSYEGFAGTAEKFVRSHPIARALGMGPQDEEQPSIAQMAQDSSERQAEEPSSLVKGVPVRQDFVNKTRTELLRGAGVSQQPGILQTTQEAVLDDTEFPKQLDALQGAIEQGPTKPEEQPVSNLLDTLKEGAKSTGRAIQAAGATARGDEAKVLQLRQEQQMAPKHPALEALMQDIQARQRGAAGEDDTWLGAAKEVAAAMAWNPDGAAHLIVEQTPNGLVPLATGAAGFFAGGLPGGVAGLFGGNVITSTGFRALEGGADEFTPEQQSEVMKKGLVEGGVITGVDVATLGMSHYILGVGRRSVEQATRETLKKFGVTDGPDMRQKLKESLMNPEIVSAVRDAQTRAYAATMTLGQRLGRGGSTVALEGFGEGTGAYLGKLAADGEASKIEAIIEGVSGLAVGGIQSAGLAAVQQKETAKLTDLTQLQTESEKQIDLDVKTEEAKQAAGVVDSEPIINEPLVELTPEEEAAARRQAVIMNEGTANILPDPEAVEDTIGLDEMMLDPLYKNPVEWETALQEHMQRDMDAGISEVVARRRALTALPEITPMTERPITWSSAPEQVGLNLKQAKLAPGSVAVVGGFNEQFSPAYTQALGSTVQEWAKRFLGKDEKVILNLSGLKGSAVGGYQQTPSGIHVISPRELVRTELSERFTGEGITLDVTQPGQQGYNTFTQQQTFGGLTHEFGHAVAMANFTSAMPEQFIGIVGKLDSGKIYTEKQLSEMPEPEAAVVRDYQQRKSDILAGKMTAEELIENWIGTWKLGRDLMKGQSRDLYSYAKEVLLREAKLLGNPALSSTPLNQISALDLIHAMGRETRTEQATNTRGEPITRRIIPDAEEIAASNRRAEAYYLQFSEFMAEQFSRYAHAKDIGRGTALGTYFKRALEALRKFFQALKGRSGQSGEAIVKPGEAFTNWVDQLHVSRALGEAEAKRRRANARRFKTRMEKGLQEVSKLTPARIVKKVVTALKQKEEQVGEGNAVDDLEFLAEDTEAKDDLKNRIREALPNILDRDRQDLMRLVGQGRLMEAEDQLADIISERTKQDKAYHGSPHDHSKFDSANIGTGEGAQAYGYGHYFAESKDVAEFYKKSLANENSLIYPDGSPVNVRTGGSPEGFAQVILSSNKGDYKKTRFEILGYKSDNEDANMFYDAAIDKLNVYQDAGVTVSGKKGKLYEVELAPEQDEYLLWDKPLSEQSEKVKAALGKLPKGKVNPDGLDMGGAVIRDNRNGQIKPDSVYPWVLVSGDSKFDLTQKDVDRMLANNGEKSTGENIYSRLTSLKGSQKAASEYLHSLGIRGIKYLDGSSRAKGEGSYNYVIFADSDISIVAKQDRGYGDTPDGQAVEETLSKIAPKKEASLWKKAVNFTAEFGYKLVQLQQVAHESTDLGVRAFVNYQNQMLALKNNLLQKGTTVAETWENLSRKQQEQLNTLLMKELEDGTHHTNLEQDTGTGKWSHVVAEPYRQFAQEKGIDLTTEGGQELAKLVEGIKNSILQHIQVTEATAVEIIRDKYGKAPLVAKKKEVEIRQMAQKWREAPYVPMGRYGNFVVKVFAPDAEGVRTLVYRTHFEDAASQDKMVRELKAKKLDVEYGKIDNETSMQLTLPTEFLSVLSDSGEFNSEQLQKIGEAMLPLKADKAFSKFIRDADRTAGTSIDRLRDYANWIEDSANFISKLAYGRKMTKARAVTKHSMEQAQAQGQIEVAREKQRILDTMAKSQEFMMHPLEEWFKARSFVALTFLMWAPKTALMNLTGLFQTWAAVTADYGDVQGNTIMLKATKDLTTGNTTFDENWALNKALEDGLIDQGFGYFMSGLANAGNLARRVRPTLAGKAARAFVDLGMWPFKAVELANRRLTLLTVYRAEYAKLKKEGLSPDEAMRSAYETSSRYTRLLQNDYASGNRPEIMRGKKSLFMIFLSYPQYMLWIMSGGFERGTRLAATLKGSDPRSRFGGMTMRMWLIFLAMSGVEGVPFGEAMGDLLQRMWNMFGGTTNLRVEAHRFLKDTAGVEDRYWRDVMQRGFLHDVMGVDLSGSYSLGKPLPGLGLINPHADNWREFVGEAFGELAGPFGGAVKAPLALGFDNDLTGRDIGNALPGAAGSIAKAVNAAQNGIKSAQRERILKDAQGAYRDPTKTELLLMAGGFRLSAVSKFQNLENLKREQIEYWMGRRTGLKQQFRRAMEDKDPELRADVQKEIDNFNKEIPNHALRLSGKELNQFVRQSRRAVNRLERDQYPLKQRAVSRDIDKLMN